MTTDTEAFASYASFGTIPRQAVFCAHRKEIALQENLEQNPRHEWRGLFRLSPKRAPVLRYVGERYRSMILSFMNVLSRSDKIGGKSDYVFSFESVARLAKARKQLVAWERDGIIRWRDG